ncbi:MAG: hypothetical protein KME57_11250 [Scytonema hyalinum WJT4-NPBG1]|nr:hypothetical protein [Scytonema hyalinum WJT4-NPBG1]
MKGRTKDKQKFNEEIDVLALFCFRGRAIASGGQIVLTPKRDVLHPVTLRVPQSLLGETTAGATTEGTSLRVCLRHTFGEHQSPRLGNPPAALDSPQRTASPRPHCLTAVTQQV